MSFAICFLMIKYILYFCGMGIKSNIPLVSVLKNKVEATAGFGMSIHSDFIELMLMIEESLHEHISETTLERLWGYSTRSSNTISLRTLDVLSRYVGFKSWSEFRRSVGQDSFDESEFLSGKVIETENLIKGCRICIKWLPDRICEMRYLGNGRFVAEKTVNTSVKPGDSFICHRIQVGRPLYMDDFKKSTGKKPDFKESRLCYVAGKVSGILSVEII